MPWLGQQSDVQGGTGELGESRTVGHFIVPSLHTRLELGCSIDLQDTEAKAPVLWLGHGNECACAPRTFRAATPVAATHL